MDRFTDFMVKDEVTGECFRADHLLEDVMEKLMADPKCPLEKKEQYTLISRQVLIAVCTLCTLQDTKFGSVWKVHFSLPPLPPSLPPSPGRQLHPGGAGGNVRQILHNCPSLWEPPLCSHGDEPHVQNLHWTGRRNYRVCPLVNIISKPQPFRCICIPRFLRPETAQGIFVNFKRLLEFNNGKLPFAAAQIGQSQFHSIVPIPRCLAVRIPNREGVSERDIPPGGAAPSERV